MAVAGVTLYYGGPNTDVNLLISLLTTLISE